MKSNPAYPISCELDAYLAVNSCSSGGRSKVWLFEGSNVLGLNFGWSCPGNIIIVNGDLNYYEQIQHLYFNHSAEMKRKESYRESS